MTDVPPTNPYPSEAPRLNEADGSPPDYSAALDRMKVVEPRAISFDIWARGNYTRRLVHHGRTGMAPLLVPFRTVAQMRWAYRRLALLGLPVDFIYTGGVSKPKKILTLCPADLAAINDGGWGYIATIGGSPIEVNGRECFALMGWSQLMPEEIFDWLLDEAADAFTRGEVFVAAAELVGIDPHHARPGVEATADIAHGTVLRHAKSAQALMQFEIPSIEEMSSQAFQKFLSESEDDLARFRVGFRRLVNSESALDVDDAVHEIRGEVASMRQSRRYAAMRRNIGLLGGALATVGAGVGSAAASAPEIALPVAASTGAAAATACLVDLWKQRSEAQAKLKENPFNLLWELGLDQIGKVRRSQRAVELGRFQRVADAGPSRPAEFHWLCPPTPGLKFLGIKKKDRQED